MINIFPFILSRRFFSACTAAMLVVGLSTLWGCAPDMPHVVKRADLKEYPYCVLIVVDALGPDVVKELADRGDIPNINMHILRRGLCAQNMVSVFPSITAGAITTILTGVYPSRHQIPNFSWVNRKTCEYRSYIGTDIIEFERDLYENARTIFQYLPKEESASFGFIQGHQSGMDRGLVRSAVNPFHEFAPFKYMFFSDLFSKLGLGKGIPHLLAYYEWRYDVVGHRKGKFSPKARKVMQHLDEEFGKIVGEYQRRGLYDKTYFMLSSDHGLAEARETFFIDQAFHNAGFHTKLISYNLGEGIFPPASWDRADSMFLAQGHVFYDNAIIGSAAGGFAAIDLPVNGGLGKDGKPDRKLWEQHPIYDELLHYDLGENTPAKSRTINVIKFLLSMEPVDFFIVRENRPQGEEPTKVLILSSKGKARITRQGRVIARGFGRETVQPYRYAYEVLEGKDPFGYADDTRLSALVGSGFHDGETWLKATAAHEYPDAPVQLTSIFDTSRSGTILTSMKPGWSVNAKIASRHGGYLRNEMLATFCVSGPGLSQGTIESESIVDITPTILSLLGQDPSPKNFDGKPMEQVVSARRH